ncbi:MAG: transposase [Myxococcales bacterium]|nr:transposase [Myxococcales bacterium]
MATQVAARRHHDTLYRFFSRGSWRVDELGFLLMVKILRYCVGPDAVVELVVDDTLSHHKGPKIFGLGTHRDPVRSTARHRIFAFCQSWVVVSVVVRFSFSTRPWALPVLFRLYRNKKDCPTSSYKKKTELASEMLCLLARWFPLRRFRVAADEGYSNATVAKAMPESMNLVWMMRPNAALTAMPKRSRRRKAGRPAPRCFRVNGALRTTAQMNGVLSADDPHYVDLGGV